MVGCGFMNFHYISSDDLEEEMDYSKTENVEIPTPSKKSSSKKWIFLILILFVLACILGVVLGFIIYKQNEAPRVVNVHIESNNMEDPSVAYYANMIKLSFSFQKELANLPSVIIQNKQVKVYGEGKDYYALFFVEDQTDVDQLVTFLIYDYRDIFYKKGANVSFTTDHSTVTILAFSSEHFLES